jgi:bifunctional non-homologous end joining protein LigD
VQPGFFYEPKYDGIRALADLRPPARKGSDPIVALYSRNGNDKTAQFPAIRDALARIAAALDDPILVDGEIVALDREGRPLGFQHLQGRIHLTSAGEIARADEERPAAFVAFDLLRDGRDDVRGQPLAARRLKLQDRLKVPPKLRHLIRLSEMVADDGRPLYARARREGWEGLIAKDGSAPYHSGRRTPAWRKLKLLNEQEFVIGGWTEPRATRQHFGALIVGYYDRGRLVWAGNVGTGFDQKTLDHLGPLLRARETQKSPFGESFKTMEKPHWVRPQLVAQVRFTEWTHEGLLRQPVFLGLRTDKDARDVIREQARTAPASGARTSREHERVASRGAAAAKIRTPRRSGDLARVVDRLAELEDAKKDGEVALPNGDRLRVTNLAKVFWPALGITKGELMRFYAAVSPMLLPAVDDRPLVMKRFPNGVDRQAFYQQRHPEAVPPGVRREVLPDEVEPIDEEGPRDRLIGGSLTTLLYMTQLAAISQDPWFSTVSDPFHPDAVAIDLDPQEGAGFDRVLDVARWVKDEMDRLGIPGVPKTSGSSGLHIYVPLPPGTTYETGQLLCQIVATSVSAKHPKVATVERMVRRRARGTIYVDYLQNILGKTIATAYSARASDYAGVSTPLTWQEVAEGVDPRDFTVRTALDRFRDAGDLWKKVRTGKRVDFAKLRLSATEPQKNSRR